MSETSPNTGGEQHRIPRTGDPDFDNAIEGTARLIDESASPFGLRGEGRVAGGTEPGRPRGWGAVEGGVNNPEHRLRESILSKASKTLVFGHNLAGMARHLLGVVGNSLWDNRREIIVGGGLGFAVRTATRAALATTGGWVAVGGAGAAAGAATGIYREYAKQKKTFKEQVSLQEGGKHAGNKELEDAIKIRLKAEFRGTAVDKRRIAIAAGRGAIVGAACALAGAEFVEWAAHNEVIRGVVTPVVAPLQEKLAEVGKEIGGILSHPGEFARGFYLFTNSSVSDHLSQFSEAPTRVPTSLPLATHTVPGIPAGAGLPAEVSPAVPVSTETFTPTPTDTPAEVLTNAPTPTDAAIPTATHTFVPTETATPVPTHVPTATPTEAAAHVFPPGSVRPSSPLEIQPTAPAAPKPALLPVMPEAPTGVQSVTESIKLPAGSNIDNEMQQYLAQRLGRVAQQAELDWADKLVLSENNIPDPTKIPADTILKLNRVNEFVGHILENKPPVPAGVPDLQHGLPSTAPAGPDTLSPAPLPVEHPAPIPPTEIHGHMVSGSVADHSLTYDGKPWVLLDNGNKNIGHLFEATGETSPIDQQVLADKLQEATALWAHGQLNPAAYEDLYRVFHLSNGTASIYNSLLDDDEDTLKSLIRLGIVRK